MGHLGWDKPKRKVCQSSIGWREYDFDDSITESSNPIVEKLSDLCRQLLDFILSNERIQ